jgi:hypothetical protein
MLRLGILSTLLLLTVVMASGDEQFTKLTYYYSHIIPKQTNMAIQFRVHNKDELYSSAIKQLEETKTSVLTFL